jgi:hypothetical protein
MMNSEIIQGAAQKVIIIGDQDLVENGGDYVVTGRTAYPVQLVDDEYGPVRRIGEKPVVVYLVDKADVLNGKYKLIGGPAIKVIEA